MSAQCSCCGDDGLNPVVLLLIVAGLWLLFNWIKTLIKSEGISPMNKMVKILIVIVLIAAVGIVIAVKQKETSQQTVGESSSAEIIIGPNTVIELPAATVEQKNLPRLVDLGADKCIPCKMMKPILEELNKEYKGKLQVEFYDVWKNPAYGGQYNIRIIPTQIFFDPNGKELFRHEGFFSKEDILAKWKELGFDFYK